MTAIAFMAGVVLTLALDELGQLNRRNTNGTYRTRNRATGIALLGVALAMVGIVCIVGWSQR